MHALLTSWILTFLLHSSLLGLGVLALAALLRDPGRRTWLLRAGLFGGLVTASAQVALGSTSPLEARVVLPGTHAHVTRPSQPSGFELARIDGGSTFTGNTRAEPTTPAAAPPSLPHWSTLLFVVWGLGAVFALTRLLQQRARFLGGLERRALDDDEATRLLVELVGAESARRVRVSASDHLASPLALSGREICVPSAGWRRLAPDERRGLLAHELAHLVRRDPTWFLAAQVVERALFMQPLQRLLRRRMQREAEYLCDDWAARRTNAPIALARCLATVATWSAPRATPALLPGMAENRSTLVARVERILDRHSAYPSRASQALFAGVSLLGLVLFACAAPRVEASAPSQAEIDVELFRLPPDALLLHIEGQGHARLEGMSGKEQLGEFELDDEESLAALKRVLAEAAAKFPRGGPTHGGTRSELHDKLADGTLRIRADEGSAYKYVQRVMQLCGTREVMLWDVEVAGQDPGAEVYTVPLPVDVGVRVIEEGLESAAPARIELELRAPSGAAADAHAEYRLLARAIALPAEFVQAGDDEDQWQRAGPLAELQLILDALHETTPDTVIILDVHPGVVYADVVAALDAVIQAGFTHITFIGEYR